MTRFANRGIFASAVSTFAVAAALVAGPVALAHAADPAQPPAASTTSAAPGKSVQTGTSDTATPAPKTDIQKTEVQKTDKVTTDKKASAPHKTTAAPSPPPAVAEVPRSPDALKPADEHGKGTVHKSDAAKAAQSKEHAPAPQANDSATVKKP